MIHRLRLPIIQAPMAGVATPALAAAVSNAGGLGSLGMGASTVDQAREAIIATQALTNQPFNVNVFCHQPAQRDAQQEVAWLNYLAPLFTQFGVTPPTALHEIYSSFLDNPPWLELLLELRPAVVSFHFGLPDKEVVQALTEAGMYTLATATNSTEAQRIEQAGVSAIVAQGIEAGGHRGVFDSTAVDPALSTKELVVQLVSQTNTPVIAAGGLMTGQDIRAMLNLGAVAAQLGTAFILCPESAANEMYRHQLSSARASNTTLTRVLSGRPARGLVNELIRYGEAEQAPTPAAYPLAYDAVKQLQAAAAQQDNAEFSAHWAGQGAPRARALTAEKLMLRLESELNG